MIDMMIGIQIPIRGSLIPRPETVELLSSNLLPRATGQHRWGGSGGRGFWQCLIWKTCDVMSTAIKAALPKLISIV